MKATVSDDDAPRRTLLDDTLNALDVASRPLLLAERGEAAVRNDPTDVCFRTLVEQIPAITYVAQLIDGRDLFTYVSPQVTSILGFARDDFLARVNDSSTLVELVHPDDQSRFRAELAAAHATLSPFSSQFRHRRADGSFIWVRCDAAKLPDKPGKPPSWHGVMFDLSAQKAAEALYRALVEQVPAVTYVTEQNDGVERFLYVSPQIAAMIGYTPDEFLAEANADWSRLVHAEDRERVMAAHARSATTGAPFTIEYRHCTKDERWIWVRDDARTLPAEAGAPGGPRRWQGILVDLSERKAMEAQLEHQAFHDPLTGLPNRMLLTERLERALTRGWRRATGVAVLFFDLDNFKVVNDSLGHEAGDQLLVAVAGRLTATVRDTDTVSRLGGDEFTILMEDVADPVEPVTAAHRIAQAFGRPFTVCGREVYVTASVGIAHGTGGRSRPLDLLRDADAAMYQAKRSGKGVVRLFDPTLNAQAAKRLTVEQDLRRAVERGEFTVYYQPVVDVETGRPVKVEALIRWQHPQRGLVFPADCMPLAEDLGLILPIGRWVLGEACRQMRRWHDELAIDPPLTISVNLSSRQFQDAALVENVVQALAATGLAPACLQLEITESVLVDDVEAALATIHQLRELGVRLALDDFGTGYSSLSYLRRLPVDEVKIDKSFIHGLGRDAKDWMIVQAIVALGRVLKMEVAGEGVETPEQLTQLRRLQFALAQGNLIARPRPAAETGVALASLVSTSPPSGIIDEQGVVGWP